MRLLLAFFLALSSLSIAEKPNILFIAIDDMNDWTGFLGGHPEAITPNMDKLAAKGVNFTNAHCVSPACSPSRNAVLFGVEPSKSGLYPFYELLHVPNEVLAPYTPIAQLFKNGGYQSFGAGKIHHSNPITSAEWTDYFDLKKTPLNYNTEAGYVMGNSKKMAFCPTTNPLEEHPDHQVADYGIKVINQDHTDPFFLAVGIVKPHLAFVCPQQFFDLYPEEVAAPTIDPYDLEDVPWAGRAMANFSDDYQFQTDKAWNQVRRSYLACISWADHNVGRVLDALEASPHAKNTVVVLWSDHGYGMGEKRHFRKFSLWEESTRVPFIIYDPRDSNTPANRECKEAVSLINLYRTLTDLAGIEAPAYVDGTSLAPQLKDPATEIPTPALTTWGRGNYSLRDEHWRYTRYFDGTEELYLHLNDPNEHTNLASYPEFAPFIQKLAQFLPQTEAPLVQKGISLKNVTDADQPALEETKRDWAKHNEKFEMPLERAP